MPYPDLYDVTYSYTGFQQSQGDNSFPGTQLDADLNGLQASIFGLAAFTERVVRADGALNNGIVTYDSLSPSLQSAGLSPATNWLTATLYRTGSNVVTGGKLYRALIEHTSGVFATDLAAGKWVFVADLPASDLAVSGPASAVVGNVPVFSNVDGKHVDDSGVPLSSLAPLNSPALIGNPTAPTPSPGDDDTSIATTGFVKAAVDVILGGVSSAFDTLSELAAAVALKANNDSPAFTGAPSAPTPLLGDNDTSIATTAFVQTALSTVPAFLSPQGRLTLTVGVAVTTSDVTGGTSIYWVLSGGGSYPSYSGSTFVSRKVAADLSLALDATSGHTGYHQNGKNFDLYLINDAGTDRLASGPAWASDTSRGSGAGTTELDFTKSGIPTNKNSIPVRFGSASGNTVVIAANSGTYVGTFRATGDGQASDSVNNRLLYNSYSQAFRSLRRTEPAGAYFYNTAAFRQVNANAANQVNILGGLGGSPIGLRATSTVQNTTATLRSVSVGIGLDSTTVSSAGPDGFLQCSSVVTIPMTAELAGYLPLGYRFFAWLEKGAGADDQAWFTGGVVGLVGGVWM